jgi:hypothetical protein
MTWLNNLLRKPPPAAVRAAPQRPAPPRPAPADIAALRLAVSAAPDAQARERQQSALGAALGECLQAPLADDAPATWVAAVRHCADKALALDWLGAIGDESALADIAAGGRFAEIRLAAAQRITRGDLLDALARASKNKDKGVYRHCADLLRDRRDAQHIERHAATIAAGLRTLLERAPVSVSHLLELERDWLSRAGAAPESPTQAPAIRECRELLSQANARILDETAAQRTLLDLQSAAAELAALVREDPWPAPADLAAWRGRQREISAGLSGLPAWLAATVPAQALGARLEALDRRLQGLESDAGRLADAEAFLAGLSESAPAGQTGAGADALAAWTALPKPENPALRERLATRWNALQHAPEPPAEPAAAAEPEADPVPPVPSSPLDIDALRGHLESLEKALEEGQLAQADASARHVKATLGAHRPDARLDARVQRAMARLGELRGWAQWGATKKREDLIEAAAQLRATVAAGAPDIEHLAVAIPALREEWKRLNSQGPAAKGQWETFDRALTAAYVPVAAHYAQEAERRSQAKVAREALLADWASAIDAVDWMRPDPAAIDALRDSMVTQWRTAAHATYRDERALRVRFDALIGGLDSRLDAARAAEVQRREDLIAAALAASELGDSRQATARAKELQERWRAEASTLRLRRGEEQKLWQRFRGACDAVFARRDAERAAHQAQRQERLQARAQLLEGLAAAIAGGDADALARALAQFRQDWGASAADPAEGAAQIAAQDRQARDLQREAQVRMGSLRLAAIEERFAALAQAAAPTTGVDAVELEKGRATREDLLIDLEIALGLATPGAAAELRRRRQLEQLQNRFRSGPSAVSRQADPEKALAQWYATAAPADADHDVRVAAVVRALVARAKAAIEKGPGDAARDTRPKGPRTAGRTAR